MTDEDDLTALTIGGRIDRMPFARWHGRLIGTLGSAHFVDALDATTIAFVLPVLVGLWHLTPTQAGLLISASYLGQFFGAIVGGTLAERFGRLTMLRLCIAFMSVLSLGCALAPSYVILFGMRVVQGLALGGEVPIAATYMNEVAPARFRGRATVAIQLLFGAGVSCASFLAVFLIPHYGWRSMFFVGTVPLVLAMALPRLLPESPRWLAAKGRPDEADAALRRIERNVYGDSPPPVLPEEEAGAEHTGQAARKVGFAALFAPGLVGPTMSAWIVAFFASLVAFALIGWMPTVYQRVYHLPLAEALRFTAMTGMMSLLGAGLAIVVIDRFGRKVSMTAGLAGTAVATGIIAIAGTTLGAMSVAVLISLIFVFMAVPVAGLYVYTPELYLIHVRAFGMGIASSWIRIAAVIVPPVVGLLLAAGGLRAMFAFLSASAVIAAIAMAALGIETAPARGKMKFDA